MKTTLTFQNIWDILPQIHCGECGYENCEAYATAILQGAEITKCIPGNTFVLQKLATLLDTPCPSVHYPPYEPRRAFIDETNCIGCSRCRMKCPVNAIVGTRQQMHTILDELCTGCQKCVAVCPTNCISTYKIPEHTIPVIQDFSQSATFNTTQQEQYKNVFQDTQRRFKLVKQRRQLRAHHAQPMQHNYADLLQSLHSKLPKQSYSVTQATIQRAQHLQEEAHGKHKN